MTSEKVTFRNGNEGVSTDERYSGWSCRNNHTVKKPIQTALKELTVWVFM